MIWVFKLIITIMHYCSAILRLTMIHLNGLISMRWAVCLLRITSNMELLRDENLFETIQNTKKDTHTNSRNKCRPFAHSTVPVVCAVIRVNICAASIITSDVLFILYLWSATYISSIEDYKVLFREKNCVEPFKPCWTCNFLALGLV